MSGNHIVEDGCHFPPYYAIIDRWNKVRKERGTKPNKQDTLFVYEDDGVVELPVIKVVVGVLRAAYSINEELTEDWNDESSKCFHSKGKFRQ